MIRPPPRSTLFPCTTLFRSKATLTVSAAAASRAFGAANPAFTGTYSGFVNGETLATSGVTGVPNLTTTATATSAAGDYSIVAAAGTLSAANYTFTFANGPLTVTKATLTGSASPPAPADRAAESAFPGAVHRLRQR